MVVKDIVQSLVDDGLVDSDRVGTSNYFWSFPSKAVNKVQHETILHISHTHIAYTPCMHILQITSHVHVHTSLIHTNGTHFIHTYMYPSIHIPHVPRAYTHIYQSVRYDLKILRSS